MSDTSGGLVLNDQLYNKAKFVALVLLPALGALYFALAGIWNLPDADAVVGTITVVDTFLGVLLHLSTAQYNAGGGASDGSLAISGTDADTGMPQMSMRITTDPNELVKQNHVRLKVEHSAVA